jgi:lysophospholipase L1-like esterase
MHPKIMLFLLLGMLPLFPTVYAQTKGDPTRWANDMAAFRKADSLQPPPNRGIVFTGSSSIRLWHDLADRFARRKVVNRGFGGSWLSDVVHYFPSLVLPYRPRTIVVYAGENDIADGRTAEMLAQDVDALLALRRKHLPKSKLVFIALKPSPSRAEKLEEVRKANTLIRQRLAGQKRAMFVDVFTPMLDADGKAREELFGPDRLHMNAKGYDLWTQVLAPYL